MDKFEYPSIATLRYFLSLLQKEDLDIKKYLPPIDEEWFQIMGECIAYTEQTSIYEKGDFLDCCARLLYKIAKRHELGDGNKRSSVIVVYLFCLLNNHYIQNPKKIKDQAKRVAKTKGRDHEDMMRKRVAKKLAEFIIFYDYDQHKE